MRQATLHRNKQPASTSHFGYKGVFGTHALSFTETDE
jgi:hypothetical protein